MNALLEETLKNVPSSLVSCTKHEVRSCLLENLVFHQILWFCFKMILEFLRNLLNKKIVEKIISKDIVDTKRSVKDILSGLVFCKQCRGPRQRTKVFKKLHFGYLEILNCEYSYQYSILNFGSVVNIDFKWTNVPQLGGEVISAMSERKPSPSLPCCVSV